MERNILEELILEEEYLWRSNLQTGISRGLILETKNCSCLICITNLYKIILENSFPEDLNQTSEKQIEQITLVQVKKQKQNFSCSSMMPSEEKKIIQLEVTLTVLLTWTILTYY